MLYYFYPFSQRLKIHAFVCIILLNIVDIESLSAQQNPDSVKTHRADNNAFYNAIAFQSIYIGSAMYVLQQTWYRDRKIVSLHFYNDNAAYLQVDKFGHAFGAYAMSYIGFHSLLNAGMSRTDALLYGGSVGVIMQTPIELMDGIHEGWGFSWGDIAANAIGTGIVVGQELFWGEQIIKYKFSYTESSYSRHANGYLGKNSLDRLLSDYNGHTYWLSMPIDKLLDNQIIPKWLNIAVGYGANGMYGEVENITRYQGVDIPYATRYRQYIISLDLDWTKIDTNSEVLKLVFQGLSFIKFPFPAIEFTSQGKFMGHWIYF